MSRRASLSDSHKNLTAKELEIRAAQEAKAFALGIPACPDQYVYNSRNLYAIWKRNAERLYAARKLSFSDGDSLLEFCKAQLNDQQAVMAAIFQATWASRE